MKSSSLARKWPLLTTCCLLFLIGVVGCSSPDRREEQAATLSDSVPEPSPSLLLDADEVVTWSEDQFPNRDDLINWDEKEEVDVTLERTKRCPKIEFVDTNTLPPHEFKKRYLGKKPVVLLNAEDNAPIVEALQKYRLLEDWSNYTLALKNGNRRSNDVVEVSLGKYMSEMMVPMTDDTTSMNSWYHFSDVGETQESFTPLKFYNQPKRYIFGKKPMLMFGFAASGTGVPFHAHGGVYAEVFYGMKRWFLKAPGPAPRYDPDETTFTWLRKVYPTYSKLERSKIVDCTLKRGELLYIPGEWHHSTINVGETVFMSTFVDTHSY